MSESIALDGDSNVQLMVQIADDECPAISAAMLRFDSRDRSRIRSDAANTPPDRRKGPLVARVGAEVVLAASSAAESTEVARPPGGCHN
jgi:hypothetical protein